MSVNEPSSSTQPVVFRTKFGVPLFPAVVLEAMFLMGLTYLPDGWMLTFHQVSAVVLPVLVVYFIRTTRYQVEDGILELRAGPFRRRIPVDSITVVTEYGVKRGRVYGLGTDVVAVKYGGGEVGITPKDPAGLAAALGIRLTRLGDGQAPA